jgi:hypothetical protein
VGWNEVTGKAEMAIGAPDVCDGAVLEYLDQDVYQACARFNYLNGRSIALEVNPT